MAVKQNMIEQLKELRRNVKAIRGSEIGGGFNGILMALGAEMDRKNGVPNNWNNKRTAPIAYEQAMDIDNLLENIKLICSEVKSEKHYFGMLKELASKMTSNHGKYGDR
jgi:hypothetical protein